MKNNYSFLTDDSLIKNLTEKNAELFLEKVNNILMEIANTEMQAMWNHQSNLNDSYLADFSTNVFIETATFKKLLIKYVGKLPWKNLNNTYLRRQFSKMGDIGIAALSPQVII